MEDNSSSSRREQGCFQKLASGCLNLVLIPVLVGVFLIFVEYDFFQKRDLDQPIKSDNTTISLQPTSGAVRSTLTSPETVDKTEIPIDSTVVSLKPTISTPAISKDVYWKPNDDVMGPLRERKPVSDTFLLIPEYSWNKVGQISHKLEYVFPRCKIDTSSAILVAIGVYEFVNQDDAQSWYILTKNEVSSQTWPAPLMNIDDLGDQGFSQPGALPGVSISYAKECGMIGLVAIRVMARKDNKVVIVVGTGHPRTFGKFGREQDMIDITRDIIKKLR